MEAMRSAGFTFEQKGNCPLFYKGEEVGFIDNFNGIRINDSHLHELVTMFEGFSGAIVWNYANWKSKTFATGGEITYKGVTITKLFPSGYYEFYSDKQGRFIKSDKLSRAKDIITEETKKEDGGDVSNRKWMEIKNDFTDDEGVTHIDAFLTEDDNEEGKVIATVDKEGNVTYIDGDAKTDPYAQEMIKEITAKFATGGKLENRTELVFTAKTKEDADKFEKLLNDTFWYADRNELNFNFPVSESDVDRTEKGVTNYIINKHDIHGHWESFETGGKVVGS